jgi:hypothetical protein
VGGLTTGVEYGLQAVAINITAVASDTNKPIFFIFFSFEGIRLTFTFMYARIMTLGCWFRLKLD